MSVLASEIKFYLTGGASNSDPNLSLGGVVSSTQVSGSLHGLFDSVKPEEAAAGDIEYRAIEVKNTNVSETLSDAYLYVSSETSSTDTIAALAYDSGGSQSVANESTAPSAPTLTFTTPYSKATGIALGDIAAGASKRFWVRWTVTAGALKMAADTGQLTVEGGTT